MIPIKVPYLDWIICSTRIYEYHKHIIYNIGDLCTVGTAIYKSLTKHNVNNPVNDVRNWYRVV